jgi:gentisate 1,2-dioxygenase
MTTVENRTADIDFDGPEHQAKLDELYSDFAAVGMTPLWTTREGLMPAHPTPRAVVPAWTEFDVTAADALDFFTFSDAPVFEKLNLLRTEVTG